MPRYYLVWVQHAQDQFNSLPPAAGRASEGRPRPRITMNPPRHPAVVDRTAAFG
jgi:hypothetical protein